MVYDNVLNGSNENPMCYDKDGNFMGWFSRSIAVVTFVFAKNKDNVWCVLASQRGKGTPDPNFVGTYNVPCGYLNWNETLQEAAKREIYEETGINIPVEKLQFCSLNDIPSEDERQNVTFRFAFVDYNKTIDDYHFSHKYMEKDEVEDISFIPIKDLHNYKWAFNHNELIMRYYKECILDMADITD